MAEYELSAEGHMDKLPMEDLGVVIKTLQDFDFGECPTMYFLNRLLDPYHYVGDVFLEEVYVVFLWHNHLLELIRVALLEFTDLPVVLLPRLTPKHL